MTERNGKANIMSISFEEIKFRQKYRPYLEELSAGELYCTSCGDKIKSNPNVHILFNVLQCSQCKQNFEKTDFNDGNKCILCGQTSTFHCKNNSCHLEYCKQCITRNAKHCLIKAAHEEWECFSCNYEPLWEARGIVEALLQHSFERRFSNESNNSENLNNNTSKQSVEEREDELITDDNSNYSTSHDHSDVDSDIEEEHHSRQKTLNKSSDNSNFIVLSNNSIRYQEQNSESFSEKISRKQEAEKSSIHNGDSSSDEDVSNLLTEDENSNSEQSEELLQDKENFEPLHKGLQKRQEFQITNFEQRNVFQGRRNIRDVLSYNELESETKLAERTESERLKRLDERNILLRSRRTDYERAGKLVLDVNVATNENLIVVHPNLVNCMKQHQINGIKFLWDACFESVARLKSNNGAERSGCILAHSMGLGKTFQIVAFSHTLLTNKIIGVKTILVVVPVSTINNWCHEYKIWLSKINQKKEFRTYCLNSHQTKDHRVYILKRWQNSGGVLIIGFEMYRNLVLGTRRTKIDSHNHKTVLRCLTEPGPDVIVCDEGHLLKSDRTKTSDALRLVKTPVRIALTGTPLQNNLTEYYCMLQFVKPHLLGTKDEFNNRFINPINNGQHYDSTANDVIKMKERSFILHEMLKGCVQRYNFSELAPYVPAKQEYVLYLSMSKIQIRMYEYYLNHLARRNFAYFFSDFYAFQRIMTHPLCVKKRVDENEKKKNVKPSKDTKEFVKRRKNQFSLGEEKSFESHDDQVINDLVLANPLWWNQFVTGDNLEDLNASHKLQVLFGILKECEKIGDKVLLFSKSLLTLDVIEAFLEKTYKSRKHEENTQDYAGKWKNERDYFRLDGNTSMDLRSEYCEIFNNPKNKRARLFLIAMKTGGLGINLTGANRVIIFDASFNPSMDLQAIFRIYRFGQKKECFVYRFIARGTMEEKIYNRQVTKLSLAHRVIDEKQIKRHFTKMQLAELYVFKPTPEHSRKDALNQPKDNLLRKIFSRFGHLIDGCIEHDSLLKDQEQERLNDVERKRAREGYEQEKFKRLKIEVFDPSPNVASTSQVMRNARHLVESSDEDD